MPKHPDFDSALEGSTKELDDVVLPSGKLVVTDPLVEPEAKPLEATVPPGSYAVVLGLAKKRPTCAVLRVRDERPAKWEPVKKKVETSGSACFMDVTAGRVLSGTFEPTEEELEDYLSGERDPEDDVVDEGELQEELMDALDSDEGRLVTKTLVVVAETEANVVAWGGLEAVSLEVWLGRDEKGEVTAIGLDWGVLPRVETKSETKSEGEEKPEPEKTEPAKKKKGWRPWGRKKPDPEEDAT